MVEYIQLTIIEMDEIRRVRSELRNGGSPTNLTVLHLVIYNKFKSSPYGSHAKIISLYLIITDLIDWQNSYLPNIYNRQIDLIY